MRWPLRYQIMLPMAGVMLFAVIGVAVLGALLAVSSVKARIAAQIGEVTAILEETNFPLSGAVLRQMSALCGAVLVLGDSDGKVLVSSDGERHEALIRDSSPASGEEVLEFGGYRWQRAGGYLSTSVSLAAIGRRSDGEWLHFFYPEDEYRRAWQRSFAPTLAFVVVAMPLVTLLAMLTAQRIVRRVGKLQWQVERIAGGEFGEVPVDDRDDELRALGMAVNGMAGQLADYERRIQATERMRTLALLGGGIAHQMRNAATGCAMAIDLHREECERGEPCESLTVAKRQLALMEEYLQRFLQLGREPAESTSESLELGTLLSSVLAMVCPGADHAGVALSWREPEERIQVLGNRRSLEHLVINLTMNATQAAAEAALQTGTPGRVEIELERAASDHARIVIRDSGRGPAPEIEPRLFEPFASDKCDGVGLGLAVAREVAERHRGRLTWRRKNGMTEFTVELPCGATESHGVHAVSC